MSTPKLTQGHFELLAKIIGRTTVQMNLSEQKRNHFWLIMATELAQTNPKFNATRFLTAVSARYQAVLDTANGKETM